jgi:hypothetical protein
LGFCVGHGLENYISEWLTGDPDCQDRDGMHASRSIAKHFFHEYFFSPPGFYILIFFLFFFSGIQYRASWGSLPQKC